MAIALEMCMMVVTPANWVPGPKQGHWTYDHYAALPDDGHRYEIVEGVLYMAPPSPSWSHQEAVCLLAHYLVMHVKFAGLGRVCVAPLDVELDQGRTVVQPDVVVVQNAGLEKITSSRIIGAPDLVVEVASPSTAGFDRREKQDAYARAGVPEYWYVDTAAHTVEVLILEGGAYHSQGIYSGEGKLPSQVVPTIADVPVARFFA